MLHPDHPSRIQIDFDRLRTPSAHGEVLVEPDAALLPMLVEQNRARIERYDVPIGDLSLAEARALVCDAAGMGEGPLIVTGHQPDFIHAGVWAKHVVAARLAAAVGGAALNLVVDQDAPKQTALDVPWVSGSRVRTRSIAYAQWPRGAAFEFMPASDPSACRRLAEETRRAMGPHYDASMLDAYFSTYARGGADWVEQAVGARRAVEQALGVRIADRRMSRLWCGPLMAEMLRDSRRFAAAYNQALANYRSARRVRSKDRPVPDLRCDAEMCELAVWAYRPGEPRRRLFVRRAGAALALYADDQRIATVGADSVGSWHTLNTELAALLPWVVRPRALTLTMWARLLLADVFIHGIGGAKYDRITDDLIRIYFGIEPPGMACVSATLLLDLPEHAMAPGALDDAQRRLRDVNYNPQRYADGSAMQDLLDARQEAVAASARLGRDEPNNHAARRRAFDAIRENNERIHARRPELLREAQQGLDAVHRHSLENRDARRRDYFFAMHSRPALDFLLESLPGVHALSRSTIV